MIYDYPIMPDALRRFDEQNEQRKKNKDAIMDKRIRDVETQERINTRLSFMPKAIVDVGLERIIGRSDLMAVCYLEQGTSKARTVARIQVRDGFGRLIGYGSGFLVSPRLLLTNHHVFQSADDAEKSLVDFNYEDGSDGRPRGIVTFSTAPTEFFVNDKQLDYALVAVNPIALDGKTRLDEFGWNRLIEETGKALIGECMTLIQHPNGEPKQICLRENQLVAIADDFLQYETDTEPGSSGSPVFNDQWMVVALHHSGVPKRDDNGRYLAKDGALWDQSMGEDQIAWVANEGVRISSICRHVRAQSLGEQAAGLRDKLLASGPVASGSSEITAEVLPIESYNSRAGYKEDFLSTPVAMPGLSAQLLPLVATPSRPSAGKPSYVLDYTNFSVVMNKARRIAFLTAVNIDGRNHQDIQRGHDVWYTDPRIGETEQSAPSLYKDNELDRGHLVRRLDPSWGQLATQAIEDTFHFTNCSPQHKNLNQKTWLGLEDYVLQNAAKYDMKVTVFTGPIFRDDDMPYRGYRIPAEFWKVVVIVNEQKQLSATAYLQSQKQLIRDLEFAYGPYKTYQVPVSQIENLTGLSFGNLRGFDPIESQESLGVREIRAFEDIRF